MQWLSGSTGSDDVELNDGTTGLSIGLQWTATPAFEFDCFQSIECLSKCSTCAGCTEHRSVEADAALAVFEVCVAEFCTAVADQTELVACVLENCPAAETCVR